VVTVLARLRRAPTPFPARRRRALFPLLWYAVGVLFFSILHVKKDTYLLPLVPAQTLLIAQGLTWLLAAGRGRTSNVTWASRPSLRFRPEKPLQNQPFSAPCSAQGRDAHVTLEAVKPPRTRWPRGLMAVQAVMGIGFPLGTIFLVARAPGAVAALLFCALSLAFALLAGRAGWRLDRRYPWLQATAYVFALAAFTDFAWVNADNERSPRRFCAPVAALLSSNAQATLLVSHLPEEVSVYLPLGITYDPTRDRVWVIVDDHRQRVEPTIADFQPRIADARVVAVRRVPVAWPGTDKERDHWKLFEVRVERPTPAAR
jgi:hypothetical protein